MVKWSMSAPATRKDAGGAEALSSGATHFWTPGVGGEGEQLFIFDAFDE
jgi:hypothetical protein